MQQWKYLRALRIIVGKQLARVRLIVIIQKLQEKDFSVRIKLILLTAELQRRLPILQLIPLLIFLVEIQKKALTGKKITVMKVLLEVILTRVILMKQLIQIQLRKVLRKVK